MGDDDVLGGTGEIKAVVERRVAVELGIGAVEHQHDVGPASRRAAPRISAPVYEGAGRVGRVGDEDKARALVHRFQQGVDIDAMVRLGRELHLRLVGPGADAVGAEAVFALDDVVARRRGTPD